MEFRRRGGGVLVCALMLLAGFATVATASVSSVEVFRCELDEFASELATVPEFVTHAAALRDQVGALSAEELRAVELRLAAAGPWREIPQLMASLSDQQHRWAVQKAGRMLQRAADPRGLVTESDELEEFRADFLFLLDQIATLRPMMTADHAATIARIRDKVSAAPPAAIQALKQVYEQRESELHSALSGATRGAGEGPVQTLHTPDCDKDCGDLDVVCWIDEAGCWIGAIGHVLGHIASFIVDFFDTTIPNLINQIIQLPTKVGEFFTNLFDTFINFVTNTFNNLIALIPNTVSKVLDFVGFDPNNVNWASIAGSIPTIAPPCPQQAVAIAAEVCDRGGDALTGLLFELAPDDGLSFLFKAGVALVHLPLTYLCQCNDIEEAIAFDTAQNAHRSLVSGKLDVKVTTRASQLGMNDLNAELNKIDRDVAKAETKLDVLEAKLDTLGANQGDMQEFIEKFNTMMIRIDIERNLLENKSDSISLFQLPSAFGGHLERVSSIVGATIQMNLAANQRIFNAEKSYGKGLALIGVGDFVRAYDQFRSAYSDAVRSTGGDDD